MSTSITSVPTVRARLCLPIHLAYDGTSFLQVVLCYQLHTPLPARKMLFVPWCTHTNKRARAPRTQRDRHLQSVCHLFCWHLRPHGIVGETAICCRQGWIRRGQGGEMHHAALFCWSELCEVLCRDGTWRLLFESEIIQQQKNVLFKLLSFLLLLLNRLQFPLKMLQI